MIDTKPFGSICSDVLYPGDIVKWSVWNKELHIHEKRYGVVVKIQNKMRANRLVSISEVYVYDREKIEDFYTLGLEKVEQNEEFSGSCSDIGR